MFSNTFQPKGLIAAKHNYLTFSTSVCTLGILVDCILWKTASLMQHEILCIASVSGNLIIDIYKLVGTFGILVNFESETQA